MFLNMGVGLYTSRLVLEALGVIDYGIYGLVGGIVTLFSFLNSAMSSSTQRYLSFDIGKRNDVQLRKTFNATLNIHFLVAFIVFVLAETIGLWFVNNKLNIPLERINAANWVYQFSIFTLFLSIIQVPYNALLSAREYFDVFAIISILQTLLKLIIVWLLFYLDTDSLVTYSVLTFSVSMLIQLFYFIYCKRKFPETIYHFYYDKNYYKELISYTGWNMFGNLGYISQQQLSNILLNIFFGPIVNAAYGLSTMIQGLVLSFVSNFQMALNPQIVKNYAKEDYSSYLKLIYIGSKFSFFGLLIILVPVYFNLEFLLRLWLHEVPEYTLVFTKLSLLYVLIESISNMLDYGIQATSNIKLFKIVIGVVLLASVPIVWFLFKEYKDPSFVYITFIIIAFITYFIRILFLEKIINFKLWDFLSQVLFRQVLVSLILLIYFYLIPPQKTFNLYELATISVYYCGVVILTILLFGLNSMERKLILKYIYNKIS
jgi:O-antigen/teichoic acid export membrane protein